MGRYARLLMDINHVDHFLDTVLEFKPEDDEKDIAFKIVNSERALIDGATGIQPSKAKRLVLAGSNLAAKRDVQNKEFLKKHSASIAFLNEQEQASLDNMVREIRLLKAGIL
ncbi:hypothetical protein [Chitinophaga sp.]|uniref:hypothetical protein n=1 Tax=Chitinophaga sp. TaxID=1869181 RepID=UPI0031DC050E